MASWKETLMRLSQQKASRGGTSPSNVLIGSSPSTSIDRDTLPSSFPPVDSSPTLPEETSFISTLFPITMSSVRPSALPTLQRDILTDPATGSFVRIPSISSLSPEVSPGIDSPNSPPTNAPSSSLGGSPLTQGGMATSLEDILLLGPNLEETDLGMPLPSSASQRECSTVNGEEL